MPISLKHKFQSLKADSPDSSLIQPSNWNSEHDLTLAANTVIGRGATAGAAEEIPATAMGRSLLAAADAAGARTAIGAAPTAHTHSIAQIDTLQATLDSKVTLATADGRYERVLGFTPVQQGGGTGMGPEKIRIGYDGTGVRVQVDNNDTFGRLSLEKNTVQDVRLGAVSTIGRNSSGFIILPAGYVMTGLSTNTNGEVISASTRPVQVFINGVWQTVANG